VAALQLVLERIHRHGPRPYDEVLELALYEPEHGFYGRGGGAGRGRDFLTSPEVGPLFGAVLARALDRWWDEAGRPDPWVVVDAGAGPGALSRSILAAGPACAPALRLVLVERSAQLREGYAEHIELEQPSFVLGPVQDDTAEGDDGLALQAGVGPLVTSLAELPALHLRGVVLANELLDNVPFRLLERTADGWAEVRVGEEHGALVEVLVKTDEGTALRAQRFAPAAEPGARIPLQDGAVGWLREALERVERGRVVVIDYGATTSELAARPAAEWLRTYHDHQRGGAPLEHLGLQDVTVEVATDQLASFRRTTQQRTQAEALQDWGIDELVAEGRATWEERAHLGDLEAMKARSRITEAEALLDPTGLGGFQVLEWQVD
jgi:SAM-dependent MidA family methyltransferase